MKFFKNKLAVTIVVLSVTFLGLIIFTTSRQNSGLGSSAGNALNPLQKIVYNLNNGAKNFVDFFLNFSTVRDENDRFREVLNFEETRSNYNYISTNIIHYSGDNVLDGYVVDKGSDDGIEVGMVVVAAQGLVGRVSKVANNWSIIQCIINENIKVSVMPENGRQNNGILEGYKSSKKEVLTKVNYLPMDADVKEGDVIITSGLGLVYPKEIRIGEVVSVEEDKLKVMKSVIVKPFVDFEKLEELFIVVPKDKKVIEYD